MKCRVVMAILALAVVSFLNSCGGKKLELVCNISEVSQIGINHLQPFVDALEKYKADNVRYPVQILDLIPKYIDRIPIINHDAKGFDEKQFFVLQNEKLTGSGPFIGEDRNYFSIGLYPKDDRVCLTSSRNNLCEYTSERKFWDCHK